MADVQLKNGFIRIAHMLHRAILVARFDLETQRRIVSLLVDLTYGWNRRTVEITVPELARMLDMQPSGRFRTALADLIDAGVVMQLRAGSGRLASVFAVQKNYEAWGRYSIATAFLADRFKRRPHKDTLLAVSAEDDPGGGADDVPPDPADTAATENQVSSVEGASNGAPSLISQPASVGASSIESAPVEASSNEHASTEAPRVPPPVNDARLHGGTLNPPNSSDQMSYERLKTGKTKDLTTTTTTARESDSSACLDGGTLEDVPRYRELIDRFETSAQRDAVRSCLDSAGLEAARRLIPAIVNWLDHEMIPPAFRSRIKPITVAAALLEYKGNFDARHVWAFVTDCVNRFEKEAAGTNSSIAAIADAEMSAVQRAAKVWRLVKREGLATGSLDVARQRIEQLVSSGEVVDAEELLTFLKLSRGELSIARQDHYAEKIVAKNLLVAPVRMRDAVAV